jgi:hypothetical protein
MTPRYVRFVIASVFFMAAVLLLDAPGLAMQATLGLATAAFVWFFVRRSPVDGRQIVCAIVVATLGEVVLSLGWGLYSYRNFLIPLYVPPGHGLFYLLAAESALQERIRERAPAIARGVMIAGSLIAAVSLVAFRDAWGFLWWLGALALMWKSRNRLLLSACFVYTILLEWAGTAIGNWVWAAEVPFVRLHSANPPAGVGILYILLDLIVVAITTRFMPVAGAAEGAESSPSVPRPISPAAFPAAAGHPSAFASEAAE